jgi:exosortase E/protease (VPEID-CTERM system)
VGLVLAFLSIYLWLFRKDLKFPNAFVLLPVGAVAIWILNAFRIAALVMIGSSGWPDIAQGGFHSQAGWLSFNAVSLGLLVITMRGGYFMKSKIAAPVLNVGPDPTTAYLLPFLAIVGTAMLTGAFSAGFQWLYPVRVIVAGAVLWIFRKEYGDLKWKWSWQAVAIGSIVSLLWIFFLPAEAANDKPAWPSALQSVSVYSAAAWIVFRIIGYVVVVPLAEELAFRGFLARRIMRADFHNVPIGTFSWFTFLLSSLLFGIFHGKLWLAGTGAGMLFALALYRRRSLGDAVQSHATTNALLAVYAVVTGNWSAWS